MVKPVKGAADKAPAKRAVARPVKAGASVAKVENDKGVAPEEAVAPVVNVPDSDLIEPAATMGEAFIAKAPAFMSSQSPMLEAVVTEPEPLDINKPVVLSAAVPAGDSDATVPAKLGASGKRDAIEPTAAPAPVIVKELKEGVTFEGGMLTVVSKTLSSGQTVAAYAGVHELGEGRTDVSGKFPKIDIPVSDFTDVEFPFEIRFADARTGQELFVPFLVRDGDQALRGLAPADYSPDIIMLDDKSVTFEISVAYMKDLPRKVDMLADGKLLQSAVSLAQGDKTITSHLLTFELKSPLAAGMKIELRDAATKQIIYSRVLDWVGLAGGLMRGQKLLYKRLGEAEAQILKLGAQVAASTSQSRERLLLDRLDLFYALIQDRLDTELRALNIPTPITTVSAPRGDVTYDATQIEGVGYYGLEGEGQIRWRWFGQRTNLVFRDVASTCRAVRLAYFSIPNECDVNQIKARINGRPVELKIDQRGQQLTAIAPVESGLLSAQRLNALILEVEFPYYFKAPGDDRVLSAAFSSATLCY